MSRRVPLAAAAVGLLLALLPGAARGQNSAMTESDRKWSTAAEQFVRRLERGEFDSAAASVSPVVPAGAMSAERLRMIWTQLTAQMGSLTSIEPRGVSVNAGRHAVDLAARFARSEVTTRVVFTDDARVSGFWISAPKPPEYVAPDYVTPAALAESDVTITGGVPGGQPLPGTLTLPRGVARPPVVVLVHGSGPNDRDETIGANRPFRDLAWGLASRGVAVLRYDKRTFAHPAELAGGVTADREIVLDAVAAIAAARADRRVDPARVLVLGHSLGGTLAPEIAARDGHVAGVVLLAAGARPLPQVMLEQLAYLRAIGASPAGDQYDALVAQIGKLRDHALPDDESVLGVPASYFYDLGRRDAAATARSLRVPIFVAQGGRDYQVTDADLAIWRSALGTSRAVTVREYPTLNHLFMTGTGRATPAEYTARTGHVAVEVIDDLARWALALPARK